MRPTLNFHLARIGMTQPLGESNSKSFEAVPKMLSKADVQYLVVGGLAVNARALDFVIKSEQALGGADNFLACVVT